MGKEMTKHEVMRKVLDDIQTKYKGATIGYYSEIGKNVQIKTIPTGSIAADYVLGSGWARISEVLGFPSSGKTTFALTAIANMQKADPDFTCAYIDAEYELDPIYAAALGVDMERMILCQPDDSVQGYTIMEQLISSGAMDFIVLDSIAAMIPPEAEEKEIGEDYKIASFARLTTQAIARINRLSAKFNTNVLFINQYKDAVNPSGVPGGSGTVMGNTNKYAPGGPTKDFYFQQILETKRAKQLTAKDENGVERVVSNIYQLKTLKNKIAPPYRTAQCCITFGKGLDKVQEIIGLGISEGVIKVSGAFYQIVDADGKSILPDEKPINGRNALAKFLEENNKVLLHSEKLVREKLGELRDGIDNAKIAEESDKTTED